MAIIENRSSEIGDVIVIKTNVPIIGLLALSGFIDSTTGEVSPTKLFYKRFRYSVDGINYSLWLDLTISNVSAVVVDPTNTFYIEYTYTREGTDPTGDIAFNYVQVDGTYQTGVCPDIFINSIFYQFFSCGDLDVLRWCVNVLEKIYEKGIVPTYIERGVNSNLNWVDRDYLDFWRTICCFYAMIVVYARHFETFGSDEKLLLEYLKQKGLNLCDNVSIQTLIYLKENYFDEIRQRGTVRIYKEKYSNQLNLTSIFHSKSVDDKQVNGELLRLLCYNNIDEFIFNLVEKHHIGWNIDNSSPLFKGMTNQLTVNKAYEDTEDFVSLTKIPIFNSAYCSLENDFIDGKWTFKIQGVPIGQRAGISHNLTTPNITDFTKCIKVNENLDYEITFFVKCPTIDDSDSDSSSDSFVANLGQYLTFGVVGLDQNNNIKDLININTGLASNVFVTSYQLPQQNRYYFVRGIIYNKDEVLKNTVNSWLNINTGNNLKFVEGVTKIIPQIIIENQIDVDNALYIWDLKVRPLSTPFSNGFIMPRNFIEIWCSQNNKNYTTVQVEEIIRKYLIPYNSTFKMIYMEPTAQQSSSSGSQSQSQSTSI